MILRLSILALAFALSAPLNAQTQSPATTLFQNVRIFDGKGGLLSGPSNVLIHGNKIERISATPIPTDRRADTILIDGGGRTLYVGTIDLDLRFMIWNMGLIAANADPEALDLFRKLLLASSSVPVAFPPVFFDIEAQSRRYDEMHVDGSVGTRVFYS